MDDLPCPGDSPIITIKIRLITLERVISFTKLISPAMVHYRGVPLNISGEWDMGQFIHVLFSGFGHHHVWKTFNNIQWDHNSIRSHNALLSTNLDGLVIYIEAEMGQLVWTVDCAPLTIVGILVEDSNGRALGSKDLPSNCANWDIFNSMISNSRNISKAV